MAQRSIKSFFCRDNGNEVHEDSSEVDHHKDSDSEAKSDSKTIII